MTGPALAAALLAGLAAWCALPAPRAALVVRRLGAPAGAADLRAGPAGTATLAGTRMAGSGDRRLLLTGGVAGAAVLAAGWRGPAAAAVVLGAAAVWVWRRRRAAAERAEELVRARSAEACAELAALLRAGRHPVDALGVLAEEHPDAFAGAATAGRIGGDVPAVLRRAATRPGADGLAALAAGGEVADAVGAPLAGVVDATARTLRDRQDLARETAAQLASARTTARLLAALPALPIALGAGIGADAVGFLLGGGPGVLCLLVGGALNVLGLRWVDRLARGDGG
jgi:tight adherence protein B